LADVTQQRILEWPLLLIFYFTLIIYLRNELGYVFDQKKQKEKERKGWRKFLCVCYQLCLFCMLPVKGVYLRMSALDQELLFLFTKECLRGWVCSSTYPLLSSF
jgi:hypothetical protein